MNYNFIRRLEEICPRYLPINVLNNVITYEKSFFTNGYDSHYGTAFETLVL